MQVPVTAKAATDRAPLDVNTRLLSQVKLVVTRHWTSTPACCHTACTSLLSHGMHIGRQHQFVVTRHWTSTPACCHTACTFLSPHPPPSKTQQQQQQQPSMAKQGTRKSRRWKATRYTIRVLVPRENEACIHGYAHTKVAVFVIHTRSPREKVDCIRHALQQRAHAHITQTCTHTSNNPADVSTLQPLSYVEHTLEQHQWRDKHGCTMTRCKLQIGVQPQASLIKRACTCTCARARTPVWHDNTVSFANPLRLLAHCLTILAPRLPRLAIVLSSVMYVPPAEVQRCLRVTQG